MTAEAAFLADYFNEHIQELSLMWWLLLFFDRSEKIFN